jgi:hypothetical protein
LLTVGVRASLGQHLQDVESKLDQKQSTTATVHAKRRKQGDTVLASIRSIPHLRRPLRRRIGMGIDRIDVRQSFSY